MCALELINYLKNKQNDSNCEIILKLHMSKAYDKVELSVLFAVMKKLDFSSKWIK